MKHIVHIFESKKDPEVANPHDDEDITLVTMEINFPPHTSVERILLEAWTLFYGKALDNGQVSQKFIFTFISDTTAGVTLKSNMPHYLSGSGDETFILRIEE